MNAIVPQYGFPDRYNENSLVLLVRDSRCIFAYWELSDEQMDLVTGELGCSWGEVPLVLRIYDLTGLNFNREIAHSHFDLGVHPLANNYYAKEVNANHSYCADLGITIQEGRFITLLRSNIIQTPRDTMADGSGAVWADMLDRLAGQPARSDWGIAAFSSEGVYIYVRDDEESKPEKGEG